MRVPRVRAVPAVPPATPVPEPRPSSETSSSTRSASVRSRTSTRARGPACLRAFVSPSWVTRNSTSSVASGSSGAPPIRTRSTVCPPAVRACVTSDSRSASRGRESAPASSSRRVCTRVCSSRTACRADSSTPLRWPSAAVGSRCRSRRPAPACTPIAVTWWATTSCSSRPIRRRSRVTACWASSSCCARISACARRSSSCSSACAHARLPNSHAPVKYAAFTSTWMIRNAKYALTPRSPVSGSVNPRTDAATSQAAIATTMISRTRRARRRSGVHAPTE